MTSLRLPDTIPADATMEFYVCTGASSQQLIFSKAAPMKPYAEIAAERRVKIIENKPLIPTGFCHMCAYKVPPKAHYCSTPCAQDYAAERKELLG